MGLKTTYYLRSLAASQVEKSTVSTEGTHLRKPNETQQKTVIDTPIVSAEIPFIPSVVPVRASAPALILSPLSTLSPITRASIEAEKVAKEVSKQNPNIKLHVAEDAICESCQ